MKNIKSIYMGLMAALILVSGLSTYALAANNSKNYQEVYNANQNAEKAKNNINQSVLDMKNIIANFPEDKITFENYKNGSKDIEKWLSDYRNAYNNLAKIKTDYYPILDDYQEKLDMYNNSGEAPLNNIKEAFRANDIIANTDIIIGELDSTMSKNIEKMEAYDKYYKARIKLDEDFERYKEAWSADPNSDLSGAWTEIINSYGNDDFSPVGYTIDQMKAMNTKDDLVKVIDAYDLKTSETFDKVKNYSEYIMGVSNEWSKNKEEFSLAVADFNSKTGNSVTVKFTVDRLQTQATQIVSAADMTIDHNVSYLRSIVDVYYEGENVYEFVYNTKSALSVRLQIIGQNNIGTILAENSFNPEVVNANFDILLVEVYDVLPPDSDEITAPNTGASHN